MMASVLSASVNIKMEDKIKRIMEKVDIVSAKNGRLRRENDKLRRDSRKMQMLIRKLSEQNSRINNTSSSSIYDDIDGYVSVRGRRKSTPPLSSSVNNNKTKPHRRSSFINLSITRWGKAENKNNNNNTSNGRSIRINGLNGGFKSSR